MNEAEFEAILSGVLKKAFPFLPPNSIKHQLHFKLQIGRKQVSIGKKDDFSRSRLDILVLQEDRPLAVIELKRPGLPLSDNDLKQGLSYARLLEPMAPIVIVTNSTTTEVYQSFDGSKLSAPISSQLDIQNLIKNAAAVASHTTQDAIAALLGPTSETAKTILSSLSDDYIENLSGDWDAYTLPFPADLAFPRKIAEIIWFELAKKTQFVVLTGPPLIGKTNVLREIFELSEDRTQAVVLLVEGGTIRQGLFAFLADVLSSELGWNIGHQEARHWLLNVSNTASFRLIPQLAALAMSKKIGARIADEIKEPVGTVVDNLIRYSSRIPIGDVVGAFALVEAAKLRGPLPAAILTDLLNRKPVTDSFSPGSRLSIVMGGEILNAQVSKDGKSLMVEGRSGDHSLDISAETNLRPLIGNMTPWMILSCFASMPLLAVDENGKALGSFDAGVLAEVAKCPHILRTPGTGLPVGVLTHDLPNNESVVCHKAGIVEPITFALMHASLGDHERGEHLVDLAIESSSQFFAMRLFTALTMIAELENPEHSDWARALLQQKINPLIASFPAFH
jgi:hypothetical protein